MFSFSQHWNFYIPKIKTLKKMDHGFSTLHYIEYISQVNELNFLHTKQNYKANNIILKLHRLEPWHLIKHCSDPFHNTWLKNLLFHTHVSPCKRGHIVTSGQLKVHTSLVNATKTYFVLFFSTLEFLYSQESNKTS